MLQAFDEGNSHAWGNIEYDEDPWVFNASRPYFVTAGLQNRHLSLWASHGRYWDAERGWKWQRPNLFCTTEDLFTQTIVVPYLIPMLENAGASSSLPVNATGNSRRLLWITTTGDPSPTRNS